MLFPLLLLSPAFADDSSTAALPVRPAVHAAVSVSATVAPVPLAEPEATALTEVPADSAERVAPTGVDVPGEPMVPPVLEGPAAEPSDRPGLASMETAAAPSLDPETLHQLAQRDAAALGPLSIGTPDAGLLVNPRPMPEGELWTLRNPFETWGTQETIDFVVGAVEAVEARFPGSPRLVIGDISRPDGGRLNRHKSHQVGRDVDIGFYYSNGEAGDFRQARKGQIDLPRTWGLVRAFVTGSDVDRIFVDRSIIALLYRYAREGEGEDVDWLDDVFGRGERKGIIQHEKRHKDHLHVRFFNRVAQEKGRIVYPVLVEAGVVGPPMVRHRARRGETLGHMASAYGTSVSAIKAANGLRSSRLRAGRSYLVPVRRVDRDDTPTAVPPRRLPPSLSTEAAITTPTAEPATPEPSEPALSGGGQN